MNYCKDFILPEIINAGIFDSSLKYRDICITPQRNVDLYEIEFFINDGGSACINGIEYPIINGNLLVSKPGQIRNSILPFKCYYVHITLEQGVLLHYLNNTPDIMNVTQKQIYVDLFNSIMNDYNSPFEGSEIHIKLKLLELIYKVYIDSLLYNRQSLLPNKIDNSIILKAMEYLDKNYQSQITLDLVSKAVNLSAIYFHKLFTVLVGKTPHRYLLEKRLSTAKDLLLTSDLSLTQIAFECGFSSQSYFNYIFKKEVNLTPRQFRGKRYLKDNL